MLASGCDETDAPDPVARSPARYLWATLIARLFEIFPLTCRYCGAEMKIIAFVIETPSVRAILEHIGEPTRPPAISPARPCAPQSCSACVPAQTFLGFGVRCSITAHPPAWESASLDLDCAYDPLAQPEPEPEPEIEFDNCIAAQQFPVGYRG